MLVQECTVHTIFSMTSLKLTVLGADMAFCKEVLCRESKYLLLLSTAGSIHHHIWAQNLSKRLHTYLYLSEQIDWSHPRHMLKMAPLVDIWMSSLNLWRTNSQRSGQVLIVPRRAYYK